MSTRDTSVILIGEDGWVDSDSELRSENSDTALGFHRRWWRGVTFFHRDGKRYQVTSAVPTRPLPPLSAFLARTPA